MERVEDSNKRIIVEETVRQIGYLPEVSEDVVGPISRDTYVDDGGTLLSVTPLRFYQIIRCHI